MYDIRCVNQLKGMLTCSHIWVKELVHCLTLPMHLWLVSFSIVVSCPLAVCTWTARLSCLCFGMLMKWDLAKPHTRFHTFAQPAWCWFYEMDSSFYRTFECTLLHYHGCIVKYRKYCLQISVFPAGFALREYRNLPAIFSCILTIQP